MLQQDAHKLARRWIDKGQRCKSKKLDGAFDCYFSYFVAFNALYFIASADLRAEDRAPEKSHLDSVAAVEGVTIYLGAPRLWQQLTDSCSGDIEALRKGLSDGSYGVSTSLTSGEVETTKDKELADLLQTGSVEQRCHALLKILYKARCNMFHGKKLPTHIQIKPLGHLSSILYVVTELLCSTLHAGA